MALTVNSCWILVLSACLALTARAECGRECALCVYRLLGQQAETGTVTCVLECGGSVDSSTLNLCRDALSEDEHLAVDSPNLVAQEAGHLLAKKYGGFMKRYGGFMMKKGHELSDGAEGDGLGAVSKKYGGFMKKEDPGTASEEQQLDLLREVLRAGLGAEAEPQQEGEEAAKRYGGFMRSVRGGSGGEEAARDLHKRYGGFMRRVGRPQWPDEQKGYVPYKRWEGGETAQPDAQKRYGGFMD